jgi:hypothetical protein
MQSTDGKDSDCCFEDLIKQEIQKWCEEMEERGEECRRKGCGQTFSIYLDNTVHRESRCVFEPRSNNGTAAVENKTNFSSY